MRVVVSERNALLGNRLADGWSGALLARLVRRAYARATAVVAVSNGVADDLARWSGLPRAGIETIYNPVVTPELLRQQAEPVDHPGFNPARRRSSSAPGGWDEPRTSRRLSGRSPVCGARAAGAPGDHRRARGSARRRGEPPS